MKAKDIGNLGEERAVKFLLEKGYEIVERNFLKPFGEIDIIAKDKDFLVFIEVKARKNINFPVINEGNLAKNKNEIAINRLFAENNNLKIGDNITFKKEFFKDNKERIFKIVGLIATPDYNSSFQKSTDLIFNAIDFGVGLVSDKDKDIFNESKDFTKDEFYQLITFPKIKEEVNQKILKIIEKREQSENRNTGTQEEEMETEE